MEPGQIGLFSLAEKRLAYLDQRQVVLAKNVANTTTPNWRDRDLQPFASTLSRFSAAAEPVQTSPLHMAGSTGGPLQPDLEARPAEKAPDGNSVSLETELVKMASTDDSHELVTDLYKSYMGMFRTALGQ